MASRRATREGQRNVDETADALERLRAEIGPRIPPEEFDRYRSRAAELRAEAIRHLMHRAGVFASS